MKVAAAQMDCVVGEVAANLRKMRLLAEQAKELGAEWIVFPEMSDTGYVMQVIRECATSWSEGAVPVLRMVARELGLGTIAGVSEREGECIYNSQVVIDAGGNVIAKYRKTHLFAPAPVEEHKCFAAGAELVVAPMGELRAGLAICYDLRFPEFFRALTLDHGANLFVISSAWPLARNQHLRTLAAARAIENQSYAVVANRVGADNEVTFCGGSAIIDPSGNIVAQGSEEELVVGEISHSAIESIRDKMRVFEHRRPELYQTQLSG
ncbi:MAG: carbon-nitrogen hydrolase [Chthoniobacterales bacterium]|nr:MAG: carbon-nitrogen hydrolase [Chthoniobacterales bacterium]